jgi:hypothetical protein
VRLVTYRSERGARAGVLRGDAVVDAGPSVRELLDSNDVACAVDERASGEMPLDEVILLPPIPASSA